VTITLGTILTPDLPVSVSPYAGVQVPVQNGAFTFQVRRPSGIGTGAGTVSVQEVSGLAHGTLSQPYQVATTRRFDFNAASNITAAGFIPVRGAEGYTADRGYGWQTPALEVDRSIGSDLRRDLHFGNDNTFRIQVVPGTAYGVRHLGDPAVSHDAIEVYAEGVLQGTVASLPAGSLQAMTFTATSADDVVELRLRDAGGVDRTSWSTGGVVHGDAAAAPAVARHGRAASDAGADRPSDGRALAPVAAEAIARGGVRWTGASEGARAGGRSPR
jgi:hypothetical protein